MSESGENFELSSVEKEKITGKEMWNKLADAFGGYSQVPDHVVGMAIAGQLNNGGGITVENAATVIDHVVDQICDRWEDQDPDPKKIRAEIINGMKDQAKDWPKQNNSAWAAIDALEKN